MKVLIAIRLVSLLATSEATPFGNSRIFGVARGGKQKNHTQAVDVPPPISEDDYARAAKAIFHAVEKIEEKVHDIVEAEVDTLFHELEKHEKAAIVEKAKKTVREGAKKVKKTVDDHDHKEEQNLPFGHSHYPYSWPVEDADHRILHAIESAEKAVLHAVEEEVSTIFHELEHHDDPEAVKKAGKVLKKGIATTSKNMEDGHEQRRSRFQAAGSVIDDYLNWDYE